MPSWRSCACCAAQGLSYLLTFLFAANTVGLTGLAIQLVLFPDMDLDGPKAQPRPGAELPKVSTPMSPERRALLSVQRSLYVPLAHTFCGLVPYCKPVLCPLLMVITVRQVSLTDDIGAIRKAFRELENQAQQGETSSKS
jgi:hypothetical protein